jgi:hypothetical protein
MACDFLLNFKLNISGSFSNKTRWFVDLGTYERIILKYILQLYGGKDGQNSSDSR